MIYTYDAASGFANALDYTGKNYNAEQVMRWLDGAQLSAGKFVFVEEAAKTAVYSGSNSTFYIVYDGDNLRRCGKMLAEDMIATGKGVHYGTTDEFKAWRGR